MTTDSQIRSNVLEEIAWNPCVHIRNLSVVTGQDKGVVTLNGNVDDYDQKWLAGETAGRAFGVAIVQNEIEVCLTEASSRTDSEIAQSVSHALAWLRHIPNANVQVSVVSGRIYLTGILRWEFQKQAVTRSLRTLSGIRDLSNEISISLQLEPTHPYAISSQESFALQRLPHANLELLTKPATGIFP
ncbi:BON domain-containing protein [Curvibacter sp. APW13]|uniref:BON domain-containing protein n=1 Tax=Curvibacter sp. APW13 TaxID=3077236 RepID=UPI0028DDD4DF|nr:BON domain-containing protein [Curvibacter sp. APW13]MDT8992607.1 BON domain-containing protein [Curvibacter sp. APW13]